MLLKRILTNSARNGAALTLTTTTAIVIADVMENGETWGAINNVCHIVDGDEAEYQGEFSSRNTPIGLAIGATAMGAWGLIYEVLFGRVQFPKSLVAGSLVASGAYLIDYYIVPDQFTPGIEHKISKKWIYITYIILALTLALSPMYNRRRK